MLNKKTLVTLAVIGVVAVYVANLMTLGKQNAQLLELGKINNTYHRANSCIITMDPSMRTEDYKSGCYDRAEKITGVKVERFNVK